nr:hypothetical protein [Nanoarchaeota archaeon]
MRTKPKKDFLLKAKPGPKDLVIKPDLIIPYDKVKGIESFIEIQMRGGKSDAEIKQELVGAGWDERAINVIMYDVHIVDNNLDKLYRFVKASIDRGLTLEDVKNTLLRVGWREDIVDLVLDDFK